MLNENINKKGALIAYICYLIGIVFPVASVVGVVVNHIKRKDTRDTWVESHHRWMMRTFWFSLMWGLIVGILMLIPIVNFVAWLGFVGIAIWYIYRIVRGFLNYNDNKAMYGETFKLNVQTEKVGL
jgi:uncharacterized membrane protein